ncbi:MAG: RNA 3'-terminal phosphate cyclase [Candidatus Helarchaeota archaeon]
MTEFVEIDGAFGEGGGAILRLACAFSILTKKPVRVYNIRKNRPEPGLRTQHLVGLQALAEISRGNLENGKIGSTEILFIPNNVVPGVYHLKVGTAGSIGLILQIIQLACISIKGKVTIKIDGGATFGKWAPTIPYLSEITLPHLRQMGYNIKINVDRHGFYPKGGAKVQFEIHPIQKLKALKLEEFGEIIEVRGISISTTHLKKRDVGDRQARAARQVISKKLDLKPSINIEYVEALNPGSGICLWLKTNTGVILGADIVGEKRKSSEKIGAECAHYLCSIVEKKATVDRFFSDQIIPFMALATGTSVIRPTELTKHTRTNIWLMEKFLGKKFKITPLDNHLVDIRITNL